MVAAFDFCAFGKGGAAPSIDTAMHGLVDAAQVDHLHPDAGIAFATAADGEQLTAECFGGRVAWVPWRRPGFQLGLDIAAIKREHPEAIGVILGGHGITAWGDTSDECESHSLEIIAAAQKFIDERGAARPFGPMIFEPLPETQRRARAAALAPVLRGLASTDRRQVGHFTDSAVVLDFAGSERMPALAALGTSCPDHFLRTKVKPMVVDLPPDGPLAEVAARLRELHAAYRQDYRAYYERYATPDSPPMRGADPAIVLVPGVGMFSFGADKQTARVAGEFYVNAINVMRGAEAISTYAPIPESEKFRIEYWELEEAKLRRRPRPNPWPADRAGHRGRLGHRQGHRASGSRPRAPASWSPTGTPPRRGRRRTASGRPTRRFRWRPTSPAKPTWRRRSRRPRSAFGGVDLVVNNAGLSISKPLAETSAADWDLLHDVLGAGIVPGLAGSRRGDDRAGDGRRHRLHREQERGVRGAVQRRLRRRQGGPGAPGAAAGGRARPGRHPGQRHQPGRRRPRLGDLLLRLGRPAGRRVRRARRELGAFYAQRTLLKKEVLPEHVAAAVFALCGGDLARPPAC